MSKNPTPAELLAYWYEALAAPKPGIAIATNDRRWLSVNLWKARQLALDERLDALTLQQPGNSNEVWICHKDVEMP